MSPSGKRRGVVAIQGICNSYVLIFVPELYPDKVAGMMVEKHFWQKRMVRKDFASSEAIFPMRLEL